MADQNNEINRLSEVNCDKLTASSDGIDNASLQKDFEEFYSLHNSINSMQTEIENLQAELPDKIQRLTAETETRTRRLRNLVAEKQRKLKLKTGKVGVALTMLLIGK